MLCENDNIPHNIFHIQTACGKYPGIFHGILSLPHNIVMDLINVMTYETDEKF
jgi:hypothetical protein